MTITQAEDRLLFFLCTSLNLKMLTTELETKYACAMMYGLDKEIIDMIKYQLKLLEKSRHACKTAAKFILRFNEEILN